MKINISKFNIDYFFLISGLALLTPKIEALGFQFFISFPLLLLHALVTIIRLTIRGDYSFYKLKGGLQYYLIFFIWALITILIATFRVGSFNMMPFIYLVQHFIFSIYIFMVVYDSASKMDNTERLVKMYIRYIFFIMGVSLLLWTIENYTFLLSGSLDFLHVGDGNKFSAYTDVLVGLSGQISNINPNQIAIGSILAMLSILSYELSEYKYLTIFIFGLILTWSSAAFLLIVVSFFVSSLYSRQPIKSLALKSSLIVFLTILISSLGKNLFGAISKFFTYLYAWFDTGVLPDTFGERFVFVQMLLTDISNHAENLIIGAGYTTHLGNFYRDFGTYPNESDILDILFHTGVVGLFLIIIFYIGVFKRLFLVNSSYDYINIVSKALALFLPGLFVINLLSGSILRSNVFSPIFFVLLALIFSSNAKVLIKKKIQN